MKNKLNLSRIESIILITFLSLLVLVSVLSLFDIPSFNSQVADRMFSDSISRFLGGIIFILILISIGYKHAFTFKKPVTKSLLIIIPSMIIAINNFPFSAFLNGRTELVEPGYAIYVFLLECISIGFFEEVIFRGVIMIVILQRVASSRKGLLVAVILSSAVFGIMHLFNLFAGASLGATMLQIGYSFLMGMMWAVIYLKTRNIWLSVLLHTIYNFFGLVLFALGTVTNRYDTFTVISTTILGSIVAVYIVYLFLSIDLEKVKEITTPAASQ